MPGLPCSCADSTSVGPACSCEQSHPRCPVCPEKQTWLSGSLQLGCCLQRRGESPIWLFARPTGCGPSSSLGAGFFQTPPHTPRQPSSQWALGPLQPALALSLLKGLLPRSCHVGLCLWGMRQLPPSSLSPTQHLSFSLGPFSPL